jgi:hypothetical protein
MSEAPTCYNAEMGGERDSNPEDQPPDKSTDRAKMHLQCIGSFKAYTQAGECHAMEIWTHFDAVHDRERAYVEPSLLVLTTTDGHAVDRIDQGEYRLTDRPEISLSTDDPNAP